VKRPLIVSCRTLATAISLYCSLLSVMLIGVKIIRSPWYPLSPQTLSPRCRKCFNPNRYIFKSGKEPHGNGPCIQTIWPVLMHVAIS
jgi:hypothetical protein